MEVQLLLVLVVRLTSRVAILLELPQEPLSTSLEVLVELRLQVMVE
jgi:hypothetical protein